MYSLETLLAAAIAALFIGSIIGAAIAQRKSGTGSSKRQLETQMREMQEQQETYQQQVNEHFTETAELLNKMTDSYREVHQHLAKGAQALSTCSPQLENTLKTLGSDQEQEQDAPPQPKGPAESISPPLDYAPKSPEAGPGVLNEKFGLDKETSAAAADKSA